MGSSVNTKCEKRGNERSGCSIKHVSVWERKRGLGEMKNYQ